MLLEAKKLDKSFNGVYALKGLDLSLKEGEIHGLVGENGAGKSTFIKILGGVYTKNGGELSWNGAPFPADFGPVESRELGHQYHFPGSCADTCIFRPGKYLAWTALSPKRRSDPVEGNGKSGSEKRGRTWDPFRPEEIHFPDDSGTEEMRRDPAGHDERL